MILIKILMFIAVVICIVFIFALAFIGSQLLIQFNCRKCKFCHHIMDYKGLREDNNNGHYLFHCPKCGAWEQVPKENLFHDTEQEM